MGKWAASLKFRDERDDAPPGTLDAQRMLLAAPEHFPMIARLGDSGVDRGGLMVDVRGPARGPQGGTNGG
jgi:hypothetical protein